MGNLEGQMAQAMGNAWRHEGRVGRQQSKFLGQNEAMSTISWITALGRLWRFLYYYRVRPRHMASNDEVRPPSQAQEPGSLAPTRTLLYPH